MKTTLLSAALLFVTAFTLAPRKPVSPAKAVPKQAPSSKWKDAPSPVPAPAPPPAGSCVFAADSSQHGAQGNSAELRSKGEVVVSTPARYPTDYTIELGVWVDDRFANDNADAAELALSYVDHLNCIYAHGEGANVDDSHRVSFRIAGNVVRLFTQSASPVPGRGNDLFIQESHDDFAKAIAALGSAAPRANLLFSTASYADFGNGAWTGSGGASNGVGQGQALVEVDPGRMVNSNAEPQLEDWWGLISAHELGHALGHNGHVPTLFDTMCCSGPDYTSAQKGGTPSREFGVAERTFQRALENDECTLDRYPDPYRSTPAPKTGETWDFAQISRFLIPRARANIWRHTGTPCANGSCPGWQELDHNGRAVAIATGGSSMYQLHLDGAIWRYTGTPCAKGRCPGWTMLDRNLGAKAIAATASRAYQLREDGSMWEFTGQICSSCNCPGWRKIDHNARTAEIVAGESRLYQRHQDGTIWQFTGAPCTANACPGWIKLDENARTKAIAAGGGSTLVQMHEDGAIWQYTGKACTTKACPGWQRIDNNRSTRAIAVTGSKVYKLHADGAIWQYSGGGWTKLDHNAKTRQIVAGGGQLYQLHEGGAMWRYTGTPCSQSGCPGWQQIDHNARTRSMAAGPLGLFQLHRWGD